MNPDLLALAGLIDDAEAAPVPEHTEEFDRLVRVLKYTPGFLLIFAEVNRPAYRDRLIAAINAAVSPDPVLAPRIDLARDEVADFAALEQMLTGLPPGAKPIHLVNGDGWLRGARLSELNTRRDALAAELAVPLIWWLPHAAIERVAREAPDAWSWRGGVFEFPRPAPRFPTDWMTERHATTSAEAVGPRLQEIAAALEQDLPDAVRIYLLTEQIELLRDLGGAGEAIKVLRQDLLPLIQTHHAGVQRPLVRGMEATILAALGQLDEAKHIYQHEVLPFLEWQGAVQDIAFIAGKIADILESEGDLEQALRFRIEWQLPASKKMQDRHASAEVQLRIANLLCKRGEMDEAWRLLLNEVVVAFKQLGDVRNVAVAQGLMAQILGMRGEFALQLELLNEVLAAAEQLWELKMVGTARVWIAATQMQIHGDNLSHDELQAIISSLQVALPLLAQYPEGAGTAFVTLARALTLDGRNDEAFEALDNAEKLFAELGDADGLTQVAAMRDRLTESRLVLPTIDSKTGAKS